MAFGRGREPISRSRAGAAARVGGGEADGRGEGGGEVWRHGEGRRRPAWELEAGGNGGRLGRERARRGREREEWTGMHLDGYAGECRAEGRGRRSVGAPA